MKRLTILFLIGIFAACKNPDQVAEGDAFCTAGASVLAIDDSNVSNAIKSSIYRPSSSVPVIHTEHPDYNSRGRIVTIPVSFSNVPANMRVTPSVIDQVFFGNGVGSMKDYFYENSWGQYSLTKVATVPWATLSYSTNHYNTPQNDFTRNQSLYRDICQQSTVNWAEVDLNNDFIITPNEAQIVIVIANGGAGACRPHEVSISYNGRTYRIRNRFVVVDCTRVTDTKEGMETFAYNFSTMWHELAHGLFGLPDRYGEFAGEGVGGFYDIMDGHYSRTHMNIVDKMKIGWIRPKILLPSADRIPTGLRCFDFANIESNPAALVLYNPQAPNEYFIIENRSIAGSPRNFNAGIPSEGLAIWWSSIQTGEIRLIDQSKLKGSGRLKPIDYGIPTLDALWHFKDGDNPRTPFLLRNQNDRTDFSIRAVSPVGRNMRVEL